ncbi:MAG: hypothetical protein J7M27_09535, partial [Candidatus Latescibacteria bacterium]|nr:hypothetical protein [Candidatus Latescibacterota bacterium]
MKTRSGRKNKNQGSGIRDEGSGGIRSPLPDFSTPLPERSQKIVRAWWLYDWANSAFATSIMATILPYYYQNVAGGDLSGNRATVYW